jgi:hypothetical protein
MNNSGTGNMYVYSAEWLSVSMHNTGDVYYTGNPKRIDTDITGSGKLIKGD